MFRREVEFSCLRGRYLLCFADGPLELCFGKLSHLVSPSVYSIDYSINCKEANIAVDLIKRKYYKMLVVCKTTSISNSPK